jgi:hypothetical protein
MPISWNSLLQRLANVHLKNGSGEFCWNLQKNGKISFGYMYNALIHPVAIEELYNNKL